MNSILIDFESTGLDTENDSIIEIGAMLVDKEMNQIASVSTLVKDFGDKDITPEIQKITGIKLEEWHANAIPLLEAFGLMSAAFGTDFDYVVAFNKNFDEKLFKACAVRSGYSLSPVGNHLFQVPWLCAMVDIETNYQYRSWRLAHLALEYGVTVNPKELHRAINDVELMRKMLIAANATSESMFAFQSTPWLFIRAVVDGPWIDGGKGVKAAKEAGFSWEVAKGTDGPRFEKSWIRQVKANQVDAIVESAPFKIKVITSAT